MATLTVGPGEQYSTIAAAVAAASSGDTVDVDAGTYTNDFPTITQNLTLQAVGGTVDLVATQEPPNEKGIIDEGGPGVNVTINGFDISGAVVPDNNGAGIRYEGGSLTLNNDDLHNNQDGLLSNPDPNGTITINSSTFTANGAGDGESHNIYIGDIASFTLQNSTSSSAVVGHEVKSRAQNNTITNNLIEDGPNGNSSYEVDLPNGGNALVANNVIEKGPGAQNPIAIRFGEEGNVYASSSLTVQNNTILNNDTAQSTTAVENDTGVTAAISGNQLFGWSTVASGPANLSGNTVTAASPTLGNLNGATTTAADPPSVSANTTPVPSSSTSGSAASTDATASTTSTAGSMPITTATLGASATPTFLADTSSGSTGTPAGSAAPGTSATSGDQSMMSVAQTPATPLDPAASASGPAAAVGQASGPSSDLPSGGGTQTMLHSSSQHTVSGLPPTHALL